MLPFTLFAPAKVNLALHVLGRRADGYHELESLVAFAGVADTLALVPGEPLGISVSGPTASDSGNPNDNLVLKAVRALQARRPDLLTGHFLLTKRLPAAAGIGGGSSDAAAALRLLARLNGLRPDDPDMLAAACETGADVPVCLVPRARIMAGIGERVGPPLRLPPLPAVLVNPRVPAPTAAVFKALGLPPGSTSGASPLPSFAADPFEGLAAARNDLEAPALSVAPVIADALRLLRTCQGCRLARMSGSGATVFGLFIDRAAAGDAARALRRERPDWWVRSTVLR